MARRDEEPARREVPLVRIFLSSPGDVVEERTLARQLIDAELPKLPSLRGRLALELIAWDDPAAQIPMLATETPQESVNAARPRPATCDIVVVILWSRMGTPLPTSVHKPSGEPYLSGTEWEYLDAINSTHEPKPDVLVYRRTEKPRVDLDDPDFDEKRAQLRLVQSFFARFRNADGSLAGGVNEYATPSDFKALLRQNLEEMLYRRLQPSADDVEPRPVVAEIPAEYYDWLRRGLEKVELLGAKEGRAVTLDHVYVPALTRPVPAPEAKKRGGKEQRGEAEEQQPIPLLRRLDEESLYVPAPAGAGKSTFCRWAVLQSIAETELSHAIPAPEEFAEPLPAALRGRLPLLVPLRDFWPEMDVRPGSALEAWRPGTVARSMDRWLAAGRPDRLAPSRAPQGGHGVPVARRARRGGGHRYPRAGDRLSS